MQRKFNPEILLKKLRREFPEIKWRKYEYFGNGWDHHVIVLDEKLVFRFPKNKEYRKRFKTELELIKVIRKNVSLKIPEYVYVSGNRDFAGYKTIPGKELSRNIFKKLDKVQKEGIAEQLSRFISELHSIKPEDLKGFRIPAENPDEISEMTEKYLYPRFSRLEIKKCRAFIRELEKINAEERPRVFIHNDLLIEHIFYDEKTGKLGIIDFSDYMYGDPAGDFAGLFEYGKSFVKKVYKNYFGKKDPGLLYRAEMYFKRISLFIMFDSLKGYPCTFEEGYEMFREQIVGSSSRISTGFIN